MKGVLLTNLGSPDEATPEAVKPYLKQFLMDPYVIDTAYPLRYFLVNFLIVPKRSHESAEAYQKIWTAKGSPLVSYTKELTEKIKKIQGKDTPIEFAMRYGNPSLEKGLSDLISQGVDDLLIVPLYPQYAWASSASTEAECEKLLKKLRYKGKAKFLDAFYKDPRYINASAEIYKKQLLQHETFDHYLFSYHGIPERHLKYTDASLGNNYCLKTDNCCEKPCEANKNCYKHHCWVNTELVSAELNLDPNKVSISFQSRLGKDPWITPFTDLEYERLAKQGVKRLAVFCPSFVADCLETIEEIGMRGEEDFKKAGGEELVMISSLNAEEEWVTALSEMIKSDH